ncbi:MAG: class I SAM-dependent methyltransferase [Planctomycetota bacterium]|nr:class I SAM-dependent methyltransferase [Planctomycetota bacterium]
MSCPLCLDARPARHELDVHGSTLVRCRRCGLVRVDPLPTAAEAERLYDDAYFRDAERGYVDYVADERVFRSEFRRRLRVLARLGAEGRLLDVGCASGALLTEAKARGFDASGLEPAPATARRAAEVSGCPVSAVALRDALLAPGAYDVITLFDVLEHLVDPRAALRRLRLALAPGGLLAVTVPDYGGLWAHLSGSRWPFLTPWEHVLYFTRRTLTAALATAGFEQVRFHPACTPLSFGTLVAKSPVPAALVPPFLRHRGVGLPAGTLFATARSV